MTTFTILIILTLLFWNLLINQKRRDSVAKWHKDQEDIRNKYYYSGKKKNK